VTASSLLEPIIQKIDQKDRPKLTATVSGILRRLLLIEHLLSLGSSITIKKLHPKLRRVLIVSIYQLLFDNTIPDHAVLHSAVSLCIPHHRPYANAILRNVSRNRDDFLNNIIPGLPLHLKYSFPPDLIVLLQDTFSTEMVPDFLEYLNSDPVFHTIPVDLFLNGRLSGNKDMNAKLLLSYLHNLQGIHHLGNNELPLHKCFVQNISSQFISYLAVQLRPRSILDLCAAPGSKASLISLMAQDIQIIANDISFPRLLRLVNRKNSQITLFNKIALCCADALLPPFADNFDLILLDAPCSAFGTIRKHPDRRYDVSAGRINELSEHQYQMIKTARSSFPQAHLLYSVCTFTRAETTLLCERILNEYHFDFTRLQSSQEKICTALSEVGIPHQAASFGGVYILPDRQLNTDLFFITLFPPLTQSF